MPANVIHWPAPAGEPASAEYTLEVNGQPVFVYTARVRAEILQKEGLWSHVPEPPGQTAAFAIFDIDGPVSVVIRPTRAFREAVVLPDRAAIKASVNSGEIRFTLERPRHLTILLDGDDTHALHLFVGEPERNVPKAGDPNVTYFGPGAHEIHTLDLRNGQTLYLAGGAVVKSSYRPGDTGTYNEQWKVAFYEGSVVNVRNVSGVTIRGRGILDGRLMQHPGRSLIGLANASDVRIERVTLRDAPNWNCVISHAEHVRVTDLRIVSGRLNSDGINSCNSRDVVVRGCFVRNHDDSIVAKTMQPDRPCEDILVEDCVVWNDWGFCLGATYETRSPIRRLRFRGCDIISARHWCLGLNLSDSATVSDVVFEDIELADMTRARPRDKSVPTLTSEPRLLRFAIVQDVWGKDADRGRIRDVRVERVTVHGAKMLPSEMQGVDAEHDIRGVTIRNVRVAGEAPAVDAGALRLRANECVRDLRIE